MGEITENRFIRQAEFARLRGVSRATVWEYKSKGLLVMTDDGLVDVAASQARLQEQLDPARGGVRTGAKKPAAGSRAYMVAKTAEMEARAARQQLELRERAGELVEKDTVHRRGFTLARQAQEAMIAIPDRLASLIAAETDPAKVHELLSNELRQVANDLAKAVEEELQ